MNLGVYRGQSNSGGAATNLSLLPISLLSEILFLEGKFQPFVGAQIGVLHTNFQSGDALIRNTYLSIAPIAGVQYQFAQDFGFTFSGKHPFSFFKNEFTQRIDAFPSFSFSAGFFYCVQHR